ncbi:MAG: type II toxin-antitoxin system VapC family toxin [Spirochaetaceae bacterium]|nr:type II toxin-antitoxin system VapC family toxin [Spirochaetaceae bacterium]
MNGLTLGKIVFDTAVLIRFLKKYEGAADLRTLFPDSDLFISVITEFELLSYWRITPEEEAKINLLLSDLVVIPFTPEIKRQGIIFRRAARNKTPDSIIAATAITLNAALITHDADFENVKYPGFSVIVLK